MLRAAELAGVYVPSLCSHKELSPFGGCRLCTVEIEGARGYPLACSTLVADGMEVTTNTVALREMRQEILRLILSEHPSSCLLCGESDDCRRSLSTIRKAGVSTGCRSCPNDGDCELQQVVERVGISEIGYPVAYRGLEAEHDDPFYDRDYNLCILCGRCVRMCHEVRGASVLSFKYRGPPDAHRSCLRHVACDGRLRVLRRLRVGVSHRRTWPTRSPSGTAGPMASRPRPARSAASVAGSSWPTRMARCRRCVPATMSS